MIRSFSALAILLSSLLGLEVAHGQCPTRWNPYRTEGFDYTATVHGNLGLAFGSGRDDIYATELLHYGLNVDGRARFGQFVAGVSGQFEWGSGNAFQIIDVSLGYDYYTSGVVRYKRVLSRRQIGSWYRRRGGNLYKVRRIHTRWCNETQGIAKHNQVTAGPRFVLTQRGKGMGGQLGYRFVEVLMRSDTLLSVDVLGAYAHLTLFDGAGTEHAYGGEAKVTFAIGWWSSMFSVGYFAKTFSLMLGAGMTFWGA